MTIAEAVFQLEKEVRDRNVDAIEIEMSRDARSRSVPIGVRDALREMISYVLIEDVEFRFMPSRPLRTRRIRTQFGLDPVDGICLYSGGLDSAVGIWATASRIANLNAVFCAHSDQAYAIRTVKWLAEKQLRRLGVPLRTMYVSRIEKRGYAQTRGFLYALMGVAWMALLNAAKLVVTEVGPTMYQPRFAPLDRVTFTTHPLVLATVRTVAEGLLQRPVQIVTPFEDLTKAEIFAIAPRDLPIQKTHSCISQRFGDHDGTCHGCVVRRLAGIASDRRDVKYKRNPLLDRNANRGNLLALLRFSRDFLADADGMEEYEVGDILRYGKRDLFRRFALDNFAAIHSMVCRGRAVVEDVQHIYQEALGVLGGRDCLERRLEQLRVGAFTPMF